LANRGRQPARRPGAAFYEKRDINAGLKHRS
jgi:hypothetical protein